MKPGVQSSEFYVTLVGIGLTLVAQLNVIPHQDTWFNILALLMGILATAGYTWARTLVKLKVLGGTENPLNPQPSSVTSQDQPSN